MQHVFPSRPGVSLLVSPLCPVPVRAPPVLVYLLVSRPARAASRPGSSAQCFECLTISSDLWMGWQQILPK